MSRVTGRSVEYERPWLSVEAKEVASSDGAHETYYSVRTHDYAAVLAVLDDGRIPLVRQFRPAVERVSLELPSGLIEQDEEPADSVLRELVEETGCEADAVELLGIFDVDSGRMQTRQWAFFAAAARVSTRGPVSAEAGIEVQLVSVDELLELIRIGDFKMAGHLAVVAAALVRGLLQ